MPKLRKGDIVTFKAIVTNVADYDQGQQIAAKILPKGEELGWCLMTENAFQVDTLKLAVGDIVRRTDIARGEDGVSARFEVKAIFEGGQIATQKVGSKVVGILQLKNLERV
ncbi:MAG: hypothetical protein ABW128_16840 [Rhizorhabdus sp.]